MKRIYRDIYTRRRIMDKAVRHIKYNDGIKDILNKIKSKVSELAVQFKDIPTGRKILSLLSAALSVANAIAVANSIAEIKGNIKYLNELSSRLSSTSREFMYYKKHERDVLKTGLQLVLNLFLAYTTAVTAKLAIAKKQVTEGEDEARVVSEVMTQ